MFSFFGSISSGDGPLFRTAVPETIAGTGRGLSALRAVRNPCGLVGEPPRREPSKTRRASLTDG
jgi:hypothetical protein